MSEIQFPGAAARPTMPGPTDGTNARRGSRVVPDGQVAAAPVSPVEAEVSMLLGTPRRDDSPATAGASVSAPCDQLAPGVALHRKSRSGGRASSTTHEARAIFEPVARKEGQVQLVTPSRGGGGDTGDGRAPRCPGDESASVSALPDDLDQVGQPLLWDQPNRRWHPVDTVNLSGGVL